MFRRYAPLILVVLLAACQSGTQDAEVRRADATVPQFNAALTDACWATDRIPAETETVYEAADATGTREAREITLRAAEDRMFAVPCPDQMDTGFTASLQRALSARGLYAAAITGEYDSDTADAVRRFQAPQGLNSAVLSLQAAQQLGLVAIPRDQL